MTHQSVLFTDQLSSTLSEWLNKQPCHHLYILTDSTTSQECLPLLEPSQINNLHLLTIPAGEPNKNIDQVLYLWSELSRSQATRKSLLINLGGGMITDLGGFVASTFKRGMRFIHIPTTLLSMVDAAVGGKTGFNLQGLKNEIGLFSESELVIICPQLLATLNRVEIRSGFAEMIKHALIDTEESWREILLFDPLNSEPKQWTHLIQRSVQIKQSIVERDPHEQGIRKALNLGHTVGHAFESLSLERGQPIAHGYAVAYGLICELYLSHIQLQLSKSTLQQAVTLIRSLYGSFYFECKDYPFLIEKMGHDKKNDDHNINFTLLSDIGQVAINQQVPRDLLEEMFDYFRESVGL